MASACPPPCPSLIQPASSAFHPPAPQSRVLHPSIHILRAGHRQTDTNLQQRTRETSTSCRPLSCRPGAPPLPCPERAAAASALPLPPLHVVNPASNGLGRGSCAHFSSQPRSGFPLSLTALAFPFCTLARGQSRAAPAQRCARQDNSTLHFSECKSEGLLTSPFWSPTPAASAGH